VTKKTKQADEHVLPGSPLPASISTAPTAEVKANSWPVPIVALGASAGGA